MLVLVCLASLVLLLNVPRKTDFQRDTRNISFILRNDKMSDWENMKQGAMQAGEDMNASIHFVNLQIPSLEEQIKTIKEEIEGGCDALVISPYAATDDVSDILKQISQPVIFAESYIDSENTYIGADQSEMGKSLAQEIMRHGNYRKRVNVYISNYGSESTNKWVEGFQEVMNESNNTVNVRVLDNVTMNAVYEDTMKSPADVVVSLERVISSMVVEGTKKSSEELQTETEIYTVGNGPDIIKSLEDGDIVSTVAQDDFTMGYLSVKAALKKLENKVVQRPFIRFMIIDKEHMYQEDSEKLLFPFVR